MLRRPRDSGDGRPPVRTARPGAAFRDIPIRVLPGITAANYRGGSAWRAAPERLSLVSLSDLLVPADEVRRNIRSVAQSPLPVALYNPPGASGGSAQEALAIFREHRGEDVLCAYVKNAGRGRKPNGWASCPSSPPPRSTCPPSSLSAAPGPAVIPASCTSRAAMWRSIWNRGKWEPEERGQRLSEGSRSPPEHSALRSPTGSSLKKSENAHQPAVHNHI